MRGFFLIPFFFLFLEVAFSDAPLQFESVDLYLELDTKSLGVYQLELRYPKDQVKIVGLEGGDRSFSTPPFYDRRGFQGGRIILAAYVEEASKAPRGRIRVARLHLAKNTDDPVIWTTKLTSAADAEGQRIQPALTLQPLPHQ